MFNQNSKAMKTLKKLFLFIAVIGLLFSCSKDDGFLGRDQPELNYGNEEFCKPSNGLNQDRYVMMRVIDNNNHWINLKVHYRIIGKGPVDMVFIPGWTNPLTVYTKQFDYFRDKARSIYVDLPGHGLSDAPEGIEYTQALMADAIYFIIRKEGVHHFIGVGFSWGWKPLQLLESMHPGMITRLVLLDVGVLTWPPMSQATREATYAAQMAWTEANKTSTATEPEDFVEWVQYYKYFPNWLLANMYYHFLAEEVCQPYPWTIPILGIWRAMVPGSAAETKMKLYFPGVEIIAIGGNNHAIQWVQADLVNQLIDDFIPDRPGRRHGPGRIY